MTTRKLEHAFLKIERANSHIREFEALMPRQGLGDGYCFVVDGDAQAKGRSKVLLKFLEPSLQHSVVAGEAIYQLRSALDIAAVSLAKINRPGGSHRDVYFPFADDEASLLDVGTCSKPGPQRKIKKLSDPARAVINALRPYPGGNDLLYGLNHLRNHDVHFELIPVASAYQCSNLTAVAPFSGGNSAEDMVAGFITGLLGAHSLDTGAYNGFVIDIDKLRFIDGHYHFPTAEQTAAIANQKIYLSLQICFMQTKSFDGQPVVATLNQLLDAVHQVIIALEAVA